MQYDVLSPHAEGFIHGQTIENDLRTAEHAADDKEAVRAVLDKAAALKGLTPLEAALLLKTTDYELMESLYALARKVKESIYGRRVVLFAPLYLSDHCVNNCRYCGYRRDNDTPRRVLSQTDIAAEVRALEAMGHKRLALEAGEHPGHAPLDYILESIATVYATATGQGVIRRVNVNIAAADTESYTALKNAGIGTYILFQETYHRPTYLQNHPSGPKAVYAYHTEAMDRAMRGGVDDVGLGALFGLYDPDFDALGILYHAAHLEAVFGVGPHTVSVPRIQPALGADCRPHAVTDERLARIVAVLRLALPYTGLIVSTRENADMRKRLLTLGASQISAGSRTGVGGYTLPGEQNPQFEVSDTRGLDKTVRWLCDSGFIPSFCTACYREGRVGDRFMTLAKNGQIGDICQPNALITLKEYLCDYATPDTRAIALTSIAEELSRIPSAGARAFTKIMLSDVEDGKRDLRL